MALLLSYVSKYELLMQFSRRIAPTDSFEEAFFSALQIISKHDYVLVRGKDRTITGILTASDFNDQFRKMAELFLLVGEIENGIRGIVRGKFSGSELQAAKAPPDRKEDYWNL